ncbi:MAG: hypothetical protein Faunusvirus3_36 [Faunusvirus sp.]|jgi:hypothetical protein|uniref:RING-type domain-containing protein n=1 Tax=Faunusvirus sp. TaxID=2487766 RepID=A0A3G4ZW88_9VIRU|nr:MAG: hypothetical protein Faunusvirus3_36 [Faunusvirus sp.]
MDCSICFVDIDDINGKLYLTTECKHPCCDDCFIKWVAEKTVVNKYAEVPCPLCRQNINTAKPIMDVIPYVYNMVEPAPYIPIEHNGVNVYSFALYPSEYQPSGTVNMSRVYAQSFNFLRIMDGMAGLSYSS